MKQLFRQFSARISFLSGTPLVFVVAVIIVIAWAVTGPLFDFSNTWQLFINTLTTITTFLMVFLIQNTQNRDSKAIQLKLDELILATRGRDALIDLEDMTDEELEELDREFREIHEKQSTSQTMKKLHQKLTILRDKRQAK
ncbi:MAG: low affinity iron permease family protein [Patescibacteria group bacterium]